MEDVDLGYKIKAHGGEIRLDAGILVTHQKRWSLLSTIQTDIFDRALPWTYMILQSRTCPNDLNLRRSRLASTLSSFLGCCFLAMALWKNPSVVSVFAAVAFGTSVLLDREFYRFLRNIRGAGFAVRALPHHILFHLCSVLGSALGSALFAIDLFRKPSRFGEKATMGSRDMNVENSRDLRAHL